MSMITVGVCTYKRPDMLETCLASIINSIIIKKLARFAEVIVVDNDQLSSASEIVMKFEDSSIPVRYISEKKRGISYARNALLKNCNTQFLCFVDDDEYVSIEWASKFLEAIDNMQAEVILAPVLPVYPPETKKYLIESKIYERPRYPTGTIMNKGGTGNTLIDMYFIRKNRISFDTEYGLTGGEDSRFFADIDSAGGVMKWLDEAVAYEPVATERLSLWYIAHRAMRGGQTHVNIYLKGIRSKCTNLCIRLIEIILLTFPVVFLWLFNKSLFLKLYRRLFAALGQVFATFNKKFEMY